MGAARRHRTTDRNGGIVITENDTAYQISAASVRFGPGVTREVGMDLCDLAARRTLVLIDPVLRALPVGEVVVEALRAAHISFEIFDRIAVEPTDRSFLEAIEAAKADPFDSFVAVGGGSTMDAA